MAIVLENISLGFGGKQVLQNFSYTLPEQGLVGLCGPSGCGKTTLLHLLAGIYQPQAGTIHGLEDKRISLVFQEDRLLPWSSAAQNVSLVMPEDHPVLALPWLELVELSAEANTLPPKLSGGMQRRLAIARALAYQGDILLLDEPTNGLDNELANRVMQQIQQHYAGKLIVLVTHDRDFARQHADTLLELSGPPLKTVLF